MLCSLFFLHTFANTLHFIIILTQKRHEQDKKYSIATSTCCPHPCCGAHRFLGHSHQSFWQRFVEWRQSDSAHLWRVCVYRLIHGHLSRAVENFRGAFRQDHQQYSNHDYHPSGCRHALGLVDDQRSGTHVNLLWHTNYIAPVFSGLCLCHQRIGFCAIGQFVDHHRHYWRGIAGHQRGTGHQHRMDCGCHYLWCLLR